jgi:UDP-glucose 4-epimerase
LAEPGRRIAVIGGRTPLGREVIAMLRTGTGASLVRGVEARPARDGRDEPDIDIVPYAPDHRPLVEYLGKERIDGVVHCALVADRSGCGPRLRSADVIATMCLGSAIAHEDVRVRSWVLASSSDVYPIDSHAPRVQREDHEPAHEPDTQAASIAEAEDYARDVAVRLPHVNVAILRLQQLCGGEANGPLAAQLARRFVPVPIGFDPLVQLLHLEDAARAVVHAVELELAGLYNVASAGALHWSEAARATGRTGVPVLPFSLPLLELPGLPFLPGEIVDILWYGHVLDTAKIEHTGWHPRYDQDGCIADLRPHGAHP